MTSLRMRLLFVLWLLLPVAQIPGVGGSGAFILTSFSVTACMLMVVWSMPFLMRTKWPSTPLISILVLEFISYSLALLNLKDNPSVPIYEGYRQIGFFVGAYLFFVLVMASTEPQRHVSQFVTGFVLVSVAVGIYGFLQVTVLPYQVQGLDGQWINLGDIPWFERNVSSTLTNRNVYASYLLFVLPMTFVLFSRGRRFLGSVSLLVNVPTLLVLKGVAATSAAFAILVAYYLLPSAWGRRSVMKVTLGFLLIWSLAMVGLFREPLGRFVAATPLQDLVNAYAEGQEQSIEDRGASLNRAIEIFSAYPLIGAGPGVGRFFNYNINGTGWAESVYTMRLAETGAIGTAILIAFQTVVLIRTIRLYRFAREPWIRSFARGTLACWIGLLFFGLFETAYVVSPQVNMICWGFLGLVEASLSAIEPRDLAHQAPAKSPVRRLVRDASRS